MRKEQVPYNQSISCKTKSAGLLLKNLWTHPSCLVASSSIDPPKGLKQSKIHDASAVPYERRRFIFKKTRISGPSLSQPQIYKLYVNF